VASGRNARASLWHQIGPLQDVGGAYLVKKPWGAIVLSEQPTGDSFALQGYRSSPADSETASGLGSEPLKALPLSFKRDGFFYRQIWRQKDIALYQYGLRPAYELVIIRIQEEHFLPNGALIARREAYPSSSQWGKYGWSFGPKDRQFAVYIAEQIVDLPAARRVARIHALMDRWVEIRAALAKR
jgi:hypothetical protein